MSRGSIRRRQRQEFLEKAESKAKGEMTWLEKGDTVTTPTGEEATVVSVKSGDPPTVTVKCKDGNKEYKRDTLKKVADKSSKTKKKESIMNRSRLRRRPVQESRSGGEVFTIPEDVRLPGSNILLEKGDRIRVVDEKGPRMRERSEDDVEILLSGHNIDIPQDFVEEFRDDLVNERDFPDWVWEAIEEGPRADGYWDAWTEIEDRGILKLRNGKRYTLRLYDDDLFAIPEDWDEDDWGNWPGYY